MTIKKILINFNKLELQKIKYKRELRNLNETQINFRKIIIITEHKTKSISIIVVNGIKKMYRISDKINKDTKRIRRLTL